MKVEILVRLITLKTGEEFIPFGEGDIYKVLIKYSDKRIEVMNKRTEEIHFLSGSLKVISMHNT